MAEQSFDNLHNLLLSERKMTRLADVSVNFWEKIRDVRARLRQEYLTTQAEEARDKWMRYNRDLDMICMLRQGKIMDMAKVSTAAGTEAAVEKLTAQEQRMYHQITGAIQGMRSEVLGEDPALSPPPAPQPASIPAPCAADTSQGTSSIEPRMAMAAAATQDTSQVALATIVALQDVPTFSLPNKQTLTLHQGDIATVPPPVARILINRQVAREMRGGIE